MVTDFLTRNFFYTTSIIALAGWLGWNTYTDRVTNRRIDCLVAQKFNEQVAKSSNE